MNREQYRNDPNYVKINDTVLEKNMLMHIQDKNLHGKIFVVPVSLYYIGWVHHEGGIRIGLVECLLTY